MAEDDLKNPDTSPEPRIVPDEALRNPSLAQDGPLGRFLRDLLAVQCRCCRARQGAVLLVDGESESHLLALHAPTTEEETTLWLDRCRAAADRVLSGGVAVVLPVDGDPRVNAIAVPLQLAGYPRLLATLLLRTPDKTSLEAARQLVELTTGLVAMTHEHLAQHGKGRAAEKLGKAMETLAAVNRQNRFTGVAMAFCNEMAAQWKCERVSLGFLKGRYVRVKAMSHTEHFSRKMRLVQDIEAAMEECLDQDGEIVYPAGEEATYIHRAAGELANQHGPTAILSLPLRHEGRPEAVVTLERPAGNPFTADEIETIRVTCDLCGPRLMNLHYYDRWFGARMVGHLRRALATIVGAQYTWAKLTAVLVFAAVLFLLLAKGWYRVKAPFVLEAVSQYKVAAPFNGFIKDVGVEIGDVISTGQTALAQLDTAELRLQLAAAQAEQAGYLKQADAAMRDRKTAEAQIAQANVDKAQAEIDLLTHRINQATILSPVTGILVTGDLKRQIGAPVETGQILFEVAPLDALRAELHVPEDEIFDVVVGQEGRLATATYPGDRIPFVVERINPGAEVVNNRNVFKVRVQLLESRPWMRPGMEGVAKVTIDKRPYASIWTRKVVNWVRMKLWI